MSHRNIKQIKVNDGTVEVMDLGGQKVVCTEGKPNPYITVVADGQGKQTTSGR